jgi:hypothetical protein
LKPGATAPSAFARPADAVPCPPELDRYFSKLHRHRLWRGGAL